MDKLESGKFYGSHYHKIELNGLIITDTEYTHPHVDWHYHENPYFTFLLNGVLQEDNKKESYQLSHGDLLFHNWQDAHKNVKPPGYARGFHVEVSKKWFQKFDIDTQTLEGSFSVKNPKVKTIMSQLLVESKQVDASVASSIDMLLLDALDTMKKDPTPASDDKSWIKRLHEILADATSHHWSLNEMSQQLGLHPVYFSRAFHQHFNMPFGEYTRNLRIQKAVDLMLTRKLPLTEIAYRCQFYDQSHFTASFKKKFKVTPKQFLRLVG